MLEHTYERLEFGAVKSLVAEHALCALGRDEILQAEFSTALGAIRLRYDLVRELLAAFEEKSPLPLDGVLDARAAIDRLPTANTYLEPSEYLAIDRLLRGAVQLRRYFAAVTERYPALQRLTRSLDGIPEFERDVAKTFDEEGGIRDTASPALAEIRAEMRDLRAKIESTLDRFLHLPKSAPWLQEDFFTIRNNRYVLPIKVDSKHQVAGIIHDYSLTGETAFIEPMAVVELSNRLLDLRRDEEKEVRRILIGLADVLRAHHDIVATDSRIFATFDAVYAKARFAQRYECAIPTVGGDALEVRGGRHPLLLCALGDRCVPLDLTLRPGDGALIISGPNAGGKTTAVKTAGILSLMVQSAIPVPADASSSFPLFSNVFADIGDEQDLTAGISTFSSHLRQIKDILEHATAGSLVILDELGTATDPSEGSLLAQAILEELAGRGVLTLVTSHLPALKGLGAAYDWVRMASFGLDPDTERPNFVLSMDVPGESNALKIAKLLGIPAPVIERAYALMSHGERDLKVLVEQVRDEKERAEKLRREIEHDRVQAEQARRRYYRLIDALEAERQKLKASVLGERKAALREKERIVREARKHVERLIAHLPAKEDLLRARAELEKERAALDADVVQVERGLKRATEPARRPLRPDEIAEGLDVWVESLNGPGTIKAIFAGGKEVEVQVGTVGFRVKASDLRALRETEAPSGAAPPTARGGVSYERRALVSNDIECHGLTVDEAIERIDKFIDDAYLSGFTEIRIVHGFGTGALREGIRRYLKAHPRIASFRDGTTEEGSSATTIAALK